MPDNTRPSGDAPRSEQGEPRGDRGPRGGGGGDRGPRGGGDRGPRDGGSRDGGREGGRRPRRFHRGKVCQFCVDKTIYLDYKDLERLRMFVTDTGKILPRRITGTCASHQRMLTVSLKRARVAALLPFKAR